MESLPCLWIRGSRTPNWSILLRIISSALLGASSLASSGTFDVSTLSTRCMPPCKSRPRFIFSFKGSIPANAKIITPSVSNILHCRFFVIYASIRILLDVFYPAYSPALFHIGDRAFIYLHFDIIVYL